MKAINRPPAIAKSKQERTTAKDSCGPLFHVTPARNLRSILEQGLVPRRRSRSRMQGESTPAVYLFTTLEAAEQAVGNWLGDAFSENTVLALLQIDAGRLLMEPSPEYEWVCPEAIHAEVIRIASRNIDLLWPQAPLPAAVQARPMEAFTGE